MRVVFSIFNMENDLNLIFAIVAVLLCLLATVVVLLIYSGLFISIEISAGKPPFESLLIAYKFSRGPYKNAGALFTEVANFAPDLKCIGVYYDDPSEVAASDLRYMVGAILYEGEDTGQNNEYGSLLIKNGFKIAKLPAVSHALTTSFPFKNTLSIFLAVARVYPKLAAYIKEKNLCAHPMIEVYDAGVIHFVAPLAKQDEFYVSEAKEDYSEDDQAQDSVPPSRNSSNREDGQQSGEQDGRESKVCLKSSQSCGDAGVNLDTITKERSNSNGSGDDSTGSSFEELNIENDK